MKFGFYWMWQRMGPEFMASKVFVLWELMHLQACVVLHLSGLCSF